MLEKCHKAIQDRPGPLLEYRECDDVMMNIIKQTTKKWAIADSCLLYTSDAADE